MLFKVQIKLQIVGKHSKVYTVVRLTDNGDLISNHVPNRYIESQESDMLSQLEQTGVTNLKESMSDSNINTPNKTSAKRSNHLTVEGGKPTTQISSNKLRKIMKGEKD